jgi:hypothetical protein
MDSRDLDEVLAQLARQRHWTVHYFGGRKTPHLIAFTFMWKGSSCADVLLLRGEDEAVAYRTPVDGRTDILRPELVCWSYEGPALWTMRMVLTLDPPTYPSAPFRLYAAPDSCRLPDIETRPLVIRPVSRNS